VEELSFKTVKARLARMLVNRDQLFPDNVNLTINELAATAGTVREVMGRTFKELVDEGVLTRCQGDIQVRNLSALEMIAEE
jgi:CRP/FNR family transcriptional regulator